MLIAGFQKLSMVDFPGRLAAVVFVPLCDMRCWYCHNAHIITPGTTLIPEDHVLDYLEKRKGVLEGVVISGGEPSLRPDLIHFIQTVKSMGLLVKLDTNGANPDVLRSLISKGFLDYVAMDVKAPERKYRETVCADVDVGRIRTSIALLINGSVDYEFRTTFAPTLDKEDILDIAGMIGGAKAYYLQQYRPVTPVSGKPVLARPPAHSPEYVRETAAEMKRRLGVCEVRGL